MRTSLVCAAFLGVLAAGCAGELTGTGEGDDVQPSEDCGNGAVDSGETCDDGNIASGDGCSSTCQSEQQATPRVTLSVDKPTVTTDLLVSNEVTVTVASIDGFSGDVTLAATVTDNVGGALAGWTSTLSQTTVTLAADGTASAKLSLRVPGDTPALTGNVKITATSSADPIDTTVAVTANPTAVVTYTTTGNTCVYPPEFTLSTPIRLTVGRKLRIVNGSDPAGTACGGQACRMQIHVDGGSGIAHQPAPMDAGAAYEGTATIANSTGVTFYCHNANNATVAVEGSAQNTRQRLITVE